PGRRGGTIVGVPELITDPGDERIADYRALNDVELRTRWEPPHGMVIAEGELLLHPALGAGYRPRSHLLDVARADQLAELPGAPVYTATQEVLQRITGFRVHRGVLASFHRRSVPPPEEVLAAARRVVVCEDVNTHTNLGVI